jgi:hypothetical protein
MRIRTEAVMNIKKYIGLSLVGCLAVLSIVVLHSAAWGGCTVQERIELGKQGYDKDEVEKTCADSGENFWEALTKDVVNNLAKGATDSLTKSLDKALLGRERESTTAAPTPNGGASVCVTDAGICPLSGVPSGAPCYCQAWNGATFMGLSR